MKIKRLLIANRGEIAVRIIRSCQQLGIETILVSSAADRESMAARMATRVVCVGPARADQSYLNINAIVQAAISTNADAIHPGYGFLSENSAIAEACSDASITFVGPTPEQLSKLGDKLKARQQAELVDVPITPGRSVFDAQDAAEFALKIGYPVVIKAVGGGGGRGMKRVNSADAMPESFDLAMAEASAAFADSRIYIERYVTTGRHVEVQVLGDGEKVIHLGDRDCSVQRRYQKLIEEAPAPDIPAKIRLKMKEDAVRFAKSLSYRGLGTVEYLYDCERKEYYFLEMNARIQVEHPVTEMITGLDLVAQQLKVAQGESLELDQKDIQLTGHAIECRINAEDTNNNFVPTPGVVRYVDFPTDEGIRVDTCIDSGDQISPYYDSMAAKIIAYGESRKAARERLLSALSETCVEGVSTNIDFHCAVLNDNEFIEGGMDTGFLTRFLKRDN